MSEEKKTDQEEQGLDASQEASEEGLKTPEEENAAERGQAGGTETPEEDGRTGEEEKQEEASDAAGEDAPGTEQEVTEEGEKKSFFEKRKDKKTSKLEEKIAELEDARVRQLAEFENFRKRSEKEKSQMFEMGAKTVVEKILPVLDNFERGLAGVSEEEKGTPFVEGIDMVYKQMLTALEELGVKPIEAVGLPFDPNFHNAVMTVESEELESNTVAEELQKGYLYNDSVVRHSMVKVVS